MDADYRDRSARLALFGVLALLAGVAWLALAALQAALWLLPGLLPGGGMPGGTATFLSGITTYGLMGLAFALAGIGSIRARRWVPPLMSILAWAWLLGGVLVLVLAWAALDGVFAMAGGDGLPPDVVRIVRWLVLLAIALAGVALPALFVVVYRDPDLLRTCEARDDAASWTEGCPTAVLGLSVGLGALALLSLPMLARPLVPLFGRFVTGPWGVAWTLAGAVASAVLARWTYQMRPAGWWGSTLLMVVLGVSTTWTLWRVEPGELYAALGYSDADAALLGDTMAVPALWATALTTVLSVVYMLGIRRHFRFRSRSDRP